MLRIQSLTYRIAGRALFDDASAQLPERARIGFAGRNGTGKTTLFRLIAGEISPEGGDIAMPRAARLGRVEQEAPGGAQMLAEFVLEADTERTALLAEADSASDPARIAEIQTRLADIGAHSAPARAAAILSGLGFDAAAQQRPLSEFSGGWRMRVALAAVLFAQPDWLLLDEPTNYLDLEGTLWLVDYLKTYPASILIISHDRDILDEVCDHILHLERCKLTLWRGNYSSFERQRREKMLLQEKAAKKQDDRRKHLQSFVDRFRAKATKARQAQSRLKLLEKMQAVELITDDDVPPFRLPSPEKPLAPPIIAMEGVSAGYDGRAILSRLNLSIADDDRIGLLGANGNGKSTFAKLVAGRLANMSGVVKRSSRLECGFFAQHQIDDLDPAGTALSHIAPLMKDASEAQVRARAAQLGFPVAKADTPVAQLSGGEKARLLMGLAAFNGPHLIIMDEPTNHLDIDSRAALIEAINDYEGAIILVSHDRYLLDACADRLWLVANGTVKPFDGDMDDYRRFVLEQARSDRETARSGTEANTTQLARREAAETRRLAAPLKKQIETLEQRIEKFNTLLQKIDAALAAPDAFARDAAKAGELSRQRGEVEAAIAKAEEEWLEATSQLEELTA
ncbi:MAG: ABC-F family ATP-binding cassette domain-containing protein [Alphaproteobacteria bacterium]|nr:ABC-F family ATP-binding cassette domain-containing protein [Alphaproteobacteria bacterium]